MAQAAEVQMDAWGRAKTISNIIRPRHTSLGEGIAIGGYIFSNPAPIEEDSQAHRVQTATIHTPDGTRVALLRLDQSVGLVEGGFNCLVVEPPTNERYELTEKTITYQQLSPPKSTENSSGSRQESSGDVGVAEGDTREESPIRYGFTWRRNSEGEGVLRTVRVKVGEFASKTYEFGNEGQERVNMSNKDGDLLGDFPLSLKGQATIGEIEIPWEIDFDARAEEIFVLAQLDEFNHAVREYFSTVM